MKGSKMSHCSAQTAQNSTSANQSFHWAHYNIVLLTYLLTTYLLRGQFDFRGRRSFSSHFLIGRGIAPHSPERNTYWKWPLKGGLRAQPSPLVLVNLYIKLINSVII